MKKKMVVLILALAMIFSLIACASSETPTDTTAPTNTGTQVNTGTPAVTRDPVEINVGVYQFPNSLEVLSENIAIGRTILHNHVYDRLVKFDPNSNEWLPSIAKSWERVGNDAWTFEIDLSYVFSNGDPLTMDDIVYSIERLKDVPKQVDIGNLVKSVTYDGNTLTLVGTSSAAAIASRVLSVAIIVNKSYIENGGDDALNMRPIGTGPYTVTEFTPGSSCTIELWDGYPFEKPQIDKINFFLIAETASRYIAVETGLMNFVNQLTPYEMQMAEDDAGLSTLTGDSRMDVVFIINCAKPPFDNVNVRRALAYAFDRASFCLLQGGRLAEETTLFCGYDDLRHVSSNLPDYNLDRAREMLEAEGYSGSNPLRFELSVNGTSDPGLEMYQSTLRSIGVDMTINVKEFSVYLASEMSGEFDINYTVLGTVGATPLEFLDRYDINMLGARNVSRYSNDHVQEIIEQMRIENDQQALRRMAVEISDIIAQDVPLIPVYLLQTYCAMDKGLTGVIIDRNRIINFLNATYTS